MCLENERESQANPETEVVGYVVCKQPIQEQREADAFLQQEHPKVFLSRYYSRTSEPVYKLGEWYEAEYHPARRSFYYLPGFNWKDDPSPPGFHAFRALEDAKMYRDSWNSYDRKEFSRVVLKAVFTGVVKNGECRGSRAFRAKHRKLIEVC